jgi:predicted exporter
MRFSLWWLCVAAAIIYLLLRLPSAAWSSNIAAAMPGLSLPWQQQLLQQNNSSRHLSLMLRGPALAELQQAARQLQQQPIPHLRWTAPGELVAAVQGLYQQHQGLIASEQQRQLLQQQRYSTLVDAAWQRLLSPAPLLANALLQDPLLITQQAMEQQAGDGPLQLQQNWFELKHAAQPGLILYAELAIDPFERNNANIVASALALQLQQLQQQWPQIDIVRSGVLFHAVIAATNASFEMQVFGGLSLLAILLLLWVSFFSFRPLLLAITTLTVATVFGLAAVLICFEQPHILALVFATTLIGIAIDYSFHGMLAANQGQKYFHRMLPSLALGLLTTVLGYAALIWLPFAVLNQVAVFICTGLVAAFVTVQLVFPRWIAPGSLPGNPRLQAGCSKFSGFYQRGRPAWIWSALGVSGLLLTVGLATQLRFGDDVRLFNQSPASLLQQEQHMRQAGAQNWDSRFIVLLAEDIETLLQREQAVAPVLQHWQQHDKLKHWQATTQRLPSLQQQDALQQQLQQAYQSTAVQQYLQQLQLTPPAVHARRMTLQQLPAALRQQVQQLDTQMASVILLSGVSVDANDITQLRQLTDTYWLDPIADTNTAITLLRSQLLLWLGLAFALALALLSWRRGVKAALAIGLLLWLVIGSALLISQLLQQQLNIFNIIAALLILALALDYGVFFTARLQHAQVMQAVLLSALTSCLAFGLLSFSNTPAIASFGLTVFFGVALASMLAPWLSVVVTKEHS